MAAADKRELNEQLGSSHGSFELVLSPVLLGLFGWWLDGKIGTGPWLLIGLAVFGVVGASLKLYFEYRLRMSVVTDEARAGREALAAEHAAKRQARLDERTALEQALNDELAAVQARDEVDA